MLVLTRTKDTSVTIDGPCTVKVLEISGKKIKLGFIAERSSKVMRTELIEIDEADK